MTEDKPTWDEYAHIYITALNDYMEKAPMQEFEKVEHQRIYNYGRFIQSPQRWNLFLNTSSV